MKTNASTAGSPLSYFVLVFALAVPFWLLGGRSLPPPLSLPASALTIFVPVTAAAILCHRRARFYGVRELVRRAWDAKRIRNKLWYVPAVLLAPAIYVSSYAVMRLLRLPLPDRIELPLHSAPVLLLLFLIGGTGEELGWTGYATDPLQERWGAPKAALILGATWAIWHAIPFVQTGEPASWVAWQSLKTIAMRVIMVWLYNGSGKSVFATILYHVTDNLSWTMFPNSRSHYDPLVTGALTSLVAAVVTLSRSKRWARTSRPGSQPAKIYSERGSTVRAFETSPDAIRAQAAIDIAAPPERVAAVYRDVAKWEVTFPATIEHARVTETGDNWQAVEVTHRMEGRVPNTLIFLSNTEIGLEESKRRFDARFLNRFEPAAGGRTHYVISAHISLRGIFGILKPFLKGYVRRRALMQMRCYVLEPLKAAAENSA